jgi:hypothetical protein
MQNYIKTPFILNVNGFCGSGKSYFIQYLIKSMSDEFDCILVFSNTANFSNDYKFLEDMDKKYFIFTSLDIETKVRQIMAIQKKNRLTDTVRNVLLIFDDVLSALTNSKVFKDLITTFRHYRINIIFSLQYINASQTYLREISNYIIIFNQRTQNALRLAYENYFSDSYETFGQFKLDFVKKLQKYHFYFIDRIKNEKYIMVCPS